MNDSLKKYIADFQTIRAQTVALCQPLALEDYGVQSHADVSPPKWHLAHTTWFFETFILKKCISNYQEYDPSFFYKFNSYYHGLGEFYPRNKRGHLARPTVATVLNYRQKIESCLLEYIQTLSEEQFKKIFPILTLGLHHEQQHQELLLMDIKYNFYQDPTFPVYINSKKIDSNNFKMEKFIELNPGLTSIGYQGQDFCFDNELPHHTIFMQPFAVDTALVTNGEFLAFIEDKGYEQPQWWLADGWDWLQKTRSVAPLYWQKITNKWHQFTLSGLQELNLPTPVAHVNYFEADAFARWRGCRLLTEMEWEYFANQFPSTTATNFLEDNILHPIVQNNQILGNLWQWTQSSYLPYPGFKPFVAELGEYNGKFMNNQIVLRGGSCITPQSHIRLSYRNFFQPEKRWQFSGIRLAKDI